MLNIDFSSFVCGIMVGAIIGLIIGVFIGFGKKWKELKKAQNEWRKTDFLIGDVVQTQHGHDRGLVTKVDENNMPIKVMASPSLDIKTGERTVISYYGGVDSTLWYKTGERMTTYEWYKSYSTEEGWKRYCKDRRNQSKFV